jgi:predicted chitinase
MYAWTSAARAAVTDGQRTIPADPDNSEFAAIDKASIADQLPLQITRADLARFCPHGDSAWLDAFALHAADYCRTYNVTTLRRWRHFAAQWHAETDGLNLRNCREDMRFRPDRMLEVYGYRLGKALADYPQLREAHGTKRRLAQHLAGNPDQLAEIVYGARPELGNVEPGDGCKFIGRGPLQNTGRSIYEVIAKRLGIDCVANPELLEVPATGVMAAFVEWAMLGCNEIADTDDIVAVSHKVNGGNNGLADRKRAYAKALVIWPDIESATPSAAMSPNVVAWMASAGDARHIRHVQAGLVQCGYPCGALDGKLGVLTRRALVAFQSEHAIPATGIIDAATVTALQASDRADLGARATVTAKELAARGSKTVTATQTGKSWTVRLKLFLGFVGYDELTGMGAVDAAISKAEALKSYADRLAALPLPSGKIMIVAAIGLGAFLVWRALDQIEQRRVADARSGANLGR